MLERVAVHQTRLRTPGLGLDAKGVALGSKGLVLLPSLDRLVAFFALYTRGSSLGDLLRSLSVEVVRSKLGAREVTLSFGAESSDRLDKVAEIARLAGGYTFTGTSRHFVQYRDAGAPFGYDVAQINASDAALVLYHSAFGQTYEVERKVDLRALLLRLEPHADPASLLAEGPRWLVAEAGLGPALIQYFVRSAVDAEVGLAEWPPRVGLRRGARRALPVPRRGAARPHAAALDQDAGALDVLARGERGRGRGGLSSPGQPARVPRLRRGLARAVSRSS